jgi:hypothetical protein
LTVRFDPVVKLLAIQNPLSPFSEMLPIVFNPNVVEMTPVTVMAQVAVLLPSCVVTVTVALPGDTAVTSPLVLTVATEVLSELHKTALLVASKGKTVAVNCCVEFTERLADGGLTLTPETGIRTDITLVAVLPPS